MCRLGRISPSTVGILKHTANVPHMSYKRCNFGSHRSIIKGILHGGKRAFSAAFRFPLEGFSLSSSIAISTHALQKMQFSALRSMNN